MLVWFLKNINQIFRIKFFSKKNYNSTQSSLSKFIFALTGSYPNNIGLYEEAFMHSSIGQKDEYGNIRNYERLEFLGDSILGMVISEYVYNKVPDKKEGYLTQLRSKIVNRIYLNEIGRLLDLENQLIIELNQSVNNNIAGNLLESLIGAIYLDTGYDGAKKFIFEKIITSEAIIEKLENKIVSYKGFLLEWSQKNKKQLEFKVYKEENANNFTIFVCEVYQKNEMLSRGREVSKKKAVEKASKRAYYALQKNIPLQ